MGSFNPSDTFRVLLVDPDEVPYALAGTFGMGIFNPSDTARVVLCDPDGTPYKATGGGGGGTEIQVEGVDTADQTLVNFVSGTPSNLSISNPSGGVVQFDVTAGGTGDVVGPATAVDGDLTLFDGTTGKLIKAATGTGLVRVASGVVSIAELSGDVTTSGSNATTIANNAVTTAKINNSAVTLAKIANAAASSKLLGSGASGSGSPYAELTLGTNLSMSGTTLNASSGGTVFFNNPGLRLTTESGVPVSTSDRTSQGTLYWTPYLSGAVTYYTGSAWATETIAEISLALTLTSGKNYDVFYLHGTGLVLSSAWTNDTTRADALGTQDGVFVLGSDHTKLWIGTIRASGSNVTEDSQGNRLVWNFYNQVYRNCYKKVSATHTYNSATVRSWNNDATNQVSLVVGIGSFANIGTIVDNGPPVDASIAQLTELSMDWTSGFGATGAATCYLSMTTIATANVAELIQCATNVVVVPLGYHYFRMVESDLLNTTDTWYNYVAQVSFMN